MGRIYKGQSALRIRISTESDLSQTAGQMICYLSPGGIEGQFPAVIEEELKGILFYDLQQGDLEESGWWIFWVEVNYQDGRKGIGEKREVFLWE
ncbi:MAG: hypothetical protein PF447_08000 [Spirochaetaceae bacterium]|jgi:hypothetical protein|nr:hypothetical protein [Spirochaetaceae bacterium]